MYDHFHSIWGLRSGSITLADRVSMGLNDWTLTPGIPSPKNLNWSVWLNYVLFVSRPLVIFFTAKLVKLAVSWICSAAEQFCLFFLKQDLAVLNRYLAVDISCLSALKLFTNAFVSGISCKNVCVLCGNVCYSLLCQFGPVRRGGIHCVLVTH